jgi:hypothetical protein
LFPSPLPLYIDHSPRLNNGKSYPDSCGSTAQTGSHGSRNWTGSGVKGKK